MILHWRSPMIIAHRGASAHAPENTLPAFELAIQQNADAIELDAKLSADEQVVIIHDQSVDRTTNGTGSVRELPLAALRELDAGSKFLKKIREEFIPTLAEVFETVNRRILINIELTNYTTPFDPLPEKVLELIRQFALEERVLISSFHPLPLRRFYNLCPSIPIGFLAKRGVPGLLSRSRFSRIIVPYLALHPEKSDVSPKLVSAVQRDGFRVHTYTVNAKDEMARLFAFGVNGLITDDPLLARQVLETHQSMIDVM
jgi:glycerophosphoryl diester phosphodiesterase